MPAITQFPISTTAMQFFNLYQQMGFYGPVNVGGAMVTRLFTGVTLRKYSNYPTKPPVFDTKFCKLYKSNADELTITAYDAFPLTLNDYNNTPYSLNTVGVSHVFMQNDGVIVGTGDIRNISGAMATQTLYPWPAAGENPLFISCPGANTIVIHSPKKKSTATGADDYMTTTIYAQPTILINP